MLKKPLILFVISLLCIGSAMAQDILMGTCNAGAAKTYKHKAKFDFTIGYTFGAMTGGNLNMTPLSANVNIKIYKPQTTLWSDKIFIYPNPAKDIVYVKLPLHLQKQIQTVAVYNILGSKVVDGDKSLLLENRIGIDLQELVAGKYFIRISFSDKNIPKQTIKLIKL